jgi:hypothetical protein
MSVLPQPPRTRVCVELADEQARRLVECVWGTFSGSLLGTQGRGRAHWKKPKGHHARVVELAREGADLSTDLNGHGGTALHKACEEGDLELHRPLRAGYSAVDVNALAAEVALISFPGLKPSGSGCTRVESIWSM